MHFHRFCNVKWTRHFNEITLGKMPATNATWNQQQVHVALKDRKRAVEREREKTKLKFHWNNISEIHDILYESYSSFRTEFVDSSFFLFFSFFFDSLGQFLLMLRLTRSTFALIQHLNAVKLMCATVWCILLPFPFFPIPSWLFKMYGVVVVIIDVLFFAAISESKIKNKH